MRYWKHFKAVFVAAVQAPYTALRAIQKQLVQEQATRKQMEVALQEREIKYKTLFQLLPVGVAITNEAGQILEANTALERSS